MTISDAFESGVHSAGTTFIKNNFNKLFPKETLYVELVLNNEPRVLEQMEFDKYQEKYGELPPLNRNQ